ncbi:succinylglutamate desuccinylase/aspartoacylase family protein [Pseudobacteriovorax antillogorgiicola]|uniref:Succinylglutamate desuccinylase/Aspartoacylase catalytic domain-containing protein n=1 Tax=Pseudobacteriovorax antillogorgiicola TaxID=1513793 RepID=A0A1Y6CFI7_9BACT|nr:succinylglutamate desuccinylase/aspartoacylase family protein [Pseudobacteriovorax antillogorgiicola]TCS48967.1 hypothetical protein EDD56_1169 [Pseudobacteriovorax antillogorgiicola]SMF53638.1 hypothetical protein SAMN06296036_116145 [Pseudobacteriovorax antillogorgiicola]
MSDNFEIGGIAVPIGQRKAIDLHLGRLYDYTELTLPVEVIRGVEPGPTFFISGAVHGDELIGTAIVKKIINDKRVKKLKGTLLAIPIVNVFGFNNLSRYLPDRRDLNRCFPGTSKGSLGSTIANLFTNEILKKCQYGIDFHSGAIHRSNLPQIRISFERDSDKDLAEAFGAPVVLNSKLRDGSLRDTASDHGVQTLLFEGGEALRLNEGVIRFGVNGAFAIMEKIGMLPPGSHRPVSRSYVAHSSYWVRAPSAGMIRLTRNLGSKVREGTLLGQLTDAFGHTVRKVIAPSEGVVIGISKLPLVNKGDALFHIATFEDSDLVRRLASELNDIGDDLYV